MPVNGYRFALIICSLMCALNGCADPEKALLAPQKLASATLNGSVFLITVGGDLKPARLARIYILPSETMPNSDSVSEKETAVRKGCASLDSARPLSGQLPVSVHNWVVGRYESALSDLEETFRPGAKPPEGFALTTDENGSFSAGPLKPNAYTVVAFGRAGINEAYWKSTAQLNRGDVIQIKLASPEVGCSVVF
jgi:hypothetical protein